MGKPLNSGSTSEQNYVPSKLCLDAGREFINEPDNGLDKIDLIDSNELRLEVYLMALHQVVEQEELVALFQVMVVLSLCPLRVDFSQLCLHSLELRIVVTLLKILEDKPIVFALFHLRVVLLFS